MGLAHRFLNQTSTRIKSGRRFTVDVGQDVFEGGDEKRVEVGDVADKVAQEFAARCHRLVGSQLVNRMVHFVGLCGSDTASAMRLEKSQIFDEDRK